MRDQPSIHLVSTPLLIIGLLVCCLVLDRDNAIPEYIPEGQFHLELGSEEEVSVHGLISCRETVSTRFGQRKYLQWHFTFIPKRSGMEGMEILLSSRDGDVDFFEKTHKVAVDVGSFLEPLHGIFGAAVVAGKINSPYFAKDGSMKIKEKQNGTIRGSPDLYLENKTGEQLRVTGEFATKSPKMSDNFGIFNTLEELNTESPSRRAL